MAKVLWKLGDDISTDIIYPGRYMATVLPTETPAFVFGDITELNSMLVNKEAPADSVIVADKNFGCGSSREQAASALKGHELIIVARNFSRIFLQNCINLGVRTVVCPTIDAKEGDELEFTGDKLINKTTGKEFEQIPHAPAQQAIIDAGGLVAYTRARLIADREK